MKRPQSNISKVKKLAGIFSLILVMVACEATTKKCSEVSADNLMLEIKVIGATAVGYGEVYSCVVEQQCPEWDIADTIGLTIMYNDTSRIVEKGWRSKAKLNITFTAGEKNVPYQIMPINGFVDEKKNTWVISQIKILE